MRDFGARLVNVVNGEAPLAEKQQALRPLIDHDVDVDAIARFCLGRYVTTATPAQIAEFTKFVPHGAGGEHHQQDRRITAAWSFRMTTTSTRGGETLVGTVVQRPNNAPNNVLWVVSTASGTPKIIDVVAEGTSLRLTQRSDYASYMARNGSNVEVLISAMRKQLASSQSSAS
ncbi:MAG: ABC transporter substrate-binding protein [Acetobacteraceae bacterium]